MARLVDVKIGRNTLKFLDNRKPLFKLNSEMQKAIDEKYALMVRKEISKRKKKLKTQEALKLSNYKKEDKEAVLKINKRKAVTNYLQNIEEKSVQLQQKYESKSLKEQFQTDYLRQEKDLISGRV